MKTLETHCIALILLTSGGLSLGVNSLAADGPLVSTGEFHACALQTDGTVICWGDNLENQASPPAGEFSQISAGNEHTCGLRSNGVVECWGADYDGQASPPAAERFVGISAGGAHTCGVHSDGSIACWGNNDAGQINSPDDTFSQVSAGEFHTCGLHADGTVSCWGGNFEAQAGQPPAGQFIQISAGYFHTCGLRPSGKIACWGDDFYGQSSDPDDVFMQISAGDFHTCGIRVNNGSIGCWGADYDGQASPATGAFVQASAGGFHSCGVNSEGVVACWGKGVDGRISPPQEQLFSRISSGAVQTCGIRRDGEVDCWGNDFGIPSGPPADDFAQISVGEGHACGIRIDGTVSCWGDDFEDRASPPEGQFHQVSAGYFHTCGLRSDGAVTCWGDDSSSQSSPPIGVFSYISAGNTHTCGITEDSTVVCWGDDSNGETSMTPDSAFQQISAGVFFTCGIRADGLVDCWGDNTFGQASPLSGTFTQVSSGERHVCGLRSDGAVNCWGDNEHGQIDHPSEAGFIELSAGALHTCGVRSDGSAACWGFNGHDYTAVPAGTRSDPNRILLPVIDFNESHLLNISTRGTTTGFGMRAGFIVQGQSQRFVLMGENIAGMINPILRLFNLSDNSLIEENDDWLNHPTADEVRSTLREPGNSRDGAFARTLQQGLYYAELQDESGSGEGLVSVTATAADNFQQTYPINLSTRGPSPLEAGFIVSGDSARCFIIKAEGPHLGGHAIRDPALLVRNLDTGEILDSNNNWADHPSSELLASIAGMAPQVATEAALAIRLPQGRYIAKLYSVLTGDEGGDSIVAVTELADAALQGSSCDTERTVNVTPTIPATTDPAENIEAHIIQPTAANHYQGRTIRYAGEAITTAENISCQWDFGIGARLNAKNSVNECQGTVIYSLEGRKTIQLTVHGNGQSHTVQITLDILPRDSGKI